MESIQNYQILSNLFLITFKLLLLETTTTFSKKTLQALEIYLVNFTAQNKVYTSHYANLALEYANLV